MNHRVGRRGAGRQANGAAALEPLRPQFRGAGVGRDLLAWVIAEAKSAGYGELVCDTMPVMADALAMYRRAGFVLTEPYSAKPTPGAIFLRLALA